MIPNGKQIIIDGHNLTFESEPSDCRGCFFENRDSCPDCDGGMWVEEGYPWHTGVPTEDGTFLVLWRDTEEPIRRYSVLHWNEYNDTWYDEETSYCNWGDEDHAEVIAWQKIEPYKEKS